MLQKNKIKNKNLYFNNGLRGAINESAFIHSCKRTCDNKASVKLNSFAFYLVQIDKISIKYALIYHDKVIVFFYFLTTLSIQWKLCYVFLS